MSNYITPGSIVDVSGQYRLVGTRREVTCVKGDRVPPTPGTGQKYRLVDKTKHKSKSKA